MVKRKAMKIQRALDLYREAITPEYVASLVRASGLEPRESIFSASVVIWLMIFQRLNADATLTAAVGEIKQGASQELLQEKSASVRARADTLSSATGGYSRARTRLPLSVVENVVDKLNESLITHGTPDNTYILDGSVVTVAHSHGNVSHYSQHESGKKKAHYPLVRMNIAVNATSGYALRPECGAYSGDNVQSELALAPAVLRRLPENASVVADRYFGCFQFVHQALKNKVTPIVRLRDVVWKRLMGRIPQEGCGEQEVLWQPSRHELRRYKDIAPEDFVKGRCIWWTVKRKGFSPTRLLLFTTSLLPAKKVVALYGLRWNVETDLRSLKSTLKLSFISAHSPEMVQKEIILACAAYNLVRKLMAVVAEKLALSVRDLSFNNALRSVRAFGCAIAFKPSHFDDLFTIFVRSLTQLRLPSRRKPQKHPPRQKWGTGKPSQSSRV